jgi:hypothetical protein
MKKLNKCTLDIINGMEENISENNIKDKTVEIASQITDCVDALCTALRDYLKRDRSNAPKEVQEIDKWFE